METRVSVASSVKVKVMADIQSCPNCGKRNRVPGVAGGVPVCAACGSRLPWIVEARDSDFGSILGNKVRMHLVDFWAPWCAPCKLIEAALDELAREFAGFLQVVRADVDKAPETARAFGIRSIPTLVFIRDGEEVARQVGAAPIERIRAVLSDDLVKWRSEG